MLLFLLANAIFLGSFVWLELTGASVAIWAGWIVSWFAIDYAVMWITGYEPPNWLWGAILSALAGLWVLLASLNAGI